MEEFFDVLKTCELFKRLSDDEIPILLQCTAASAKTAEKDQYILRAGDKTDAIWILLEGSALVIKEDFWGNRSVVTKLFPGDFFAEPFALVPDAAIDVSVVASEGCKTMTINAERMLAMCSSACAFHKRLIQNFARSTAKKALLLNDKITHVSKRRTRDKILSYLSSESLRQKSPRFDIPFDRQQLADYLCVERAAMSAEISKLQKEGLLATSHSRFELGGKMKTHHQDS